MRVNRIKSRRFVNFVRFVSFSIQLLKNALTIAPGRLEMEGCLFRRRGRSLHCLLAARTALFFLGLLRSSVMVTVSLGCAPTLSTEVTRPRVPWKRINNLGNVTPTTESPKFAWLGRHRSMFTLRLHLADVMASSVLLFVFWSGSLTYYPA